MDKFSYYCRYNIIIIIKRKLHACSKHTLELKVVVTNEKEKRGLEKVWVNIYSSKLSDEEIRRVASKHNTENQGRVQTQWFERVTAFRHWLYHMDRKNFEEDETTASTSNWKRACQSIYITTNKVFLYMLSGVNFVSLC